MLSILARLITGLALLAFFCVVASAGEITRFSFSGYLGYVNVAIVAFLLILAFRHFILLFFAASEAARQEMMLDVGEKDLPGISVIVPAYNEAVVIAQTLRRLGEMDYPLFEVLVVDDGSQDQTSAIAAGMADELRKKGISLRVLTKPNAGKGVALNFGVAHSRYDFVFCMDADSHVATKALRAGIRHLLGSFDVSAVAGSVMVLNAHKMIAQFQALEYLTGLNFFKAAQSYLGLVTVIPGPSGLFRKTAITSVGGYASDTFAEDCDLTIALVSSGHQVVYEPLMEVVTEVPEDPIALIKQRYRWNRGILQATKKHLDKLRTPFEDPTGFALIVYLALETIVLPVLSISIAILSFGYVTVTRDLSMFSLWLVLLTALDLAVVLFSLSDQRWPLKLLPLAFINRISYAFAVDIVKIVSSAEELLGIKMVWGKLDRIGGRLGK